jgi:hypothetical protein
MIVDASLKLEAAPTVVTREVGGEMMLVDLESGTYFGLNDVGGRLWQLLDDGESLGRACEQLLEEFDVDSGQLHSDVGTLIDELLARKLLVTAA